MLKIIELESLRVEELENVGDAYLRRAFERLMNASEVDVRRCLDDCMKVVIDDLANDVVSTIRYIGLYYGDMLDNMRTRCMR